MRILIVKRDKLGDLLLTTPMLAWLKAAMPQAELHVLATDYNAWVLEGNPDFDRLWVTPRVRHAGRLRPGAIFAAAWQTLQLRRQHFDWVIAGNGAESPRAIQLALRVGGARTVAYCKNPAEWPRLSHALPEPVRCHESVSLARLAEPLGLAVPDALPDPFYRLPESGHRFAQGWLAERGLVSGGYVVLGLGARRAKKQPSCEQVLRWSAEFQRHWNLPTVFMWTPGKSDNPLYPGDDEVAEPILAANAPHIHPFRGPLPEALGLVWHARTSIFPDSGLMHFAAASPGGVLGLFAETDVSPHPAQWGPIGPRAHWLDAPRAVSELADEEVLALVERRVAA